MNLIARRSAVLTICLGLATAGCSSQHSPSSPQTGETGARRVVTSWCGQALLAIAGGQRLPQHLGPVTVPVAAPTESVLPQRSPQGDPALDTFTTIALTDDCASGYLVSVEPASSVRLVAIAYDTAHRGITAIVLGHVHGGLLGASPVRVRAFSLGHEVGEVVAVF